MYVMYCILIMLCTTYYFKVIMYVSIVFQLCYVLYIEVLPAWVPIWILVWVPVWNPNRKKRKKILGEAANLHVLRSHNLALPGAKQP